MTDTLERAGPPYGPDVWVKNRRVVIQEQTLPNGQRINLHITSGELILEYKPWQNVKLVWE